MRTAATTGDGLMQGTARVVATEGDQLWLEPEPQSACSGCAVRAGCGVSVFSAVFGRNPARLQLPNAIAAEVGERLLIGISPAQLLKASSLLYLLPIAGLVGGAVAGLALGGEVAAMVAGVAGLGVGFAAVRWQSGAPGRQGRLQPVILGRLPTEPEVACEDRHRQEVSLQATTTGRSE